MSDVDPLQAVRDAFSASAFAADAARTADDEDARQVVDEARRRKAEKVAYIKRVANKHNENMARIMGRSEGLTDAEIDDALRPAPSMSKRKPKPAPPVAAAEADDETAVEPSSSGGGDVWKPARNPIKPLGDGCPVRPLGKAGNLFVYLTPMHQVVTLRAQDHNANGLRALFGQRIDYLWSHWPKYNADHIQTGWKADSATESLMLACDERGVFDLFDVVRGIGGWRGDRGELIIHAGDAVWFDGAWQPPGEYGRHIYPSFPRAGGPSIDGNPDPTSCAAPLLKLFNTWHWIGPEDWRDADGAGNHLAAVLLLGWLTAAQAGGALDWRPLVWLTGDAGSGKSTLQTALDWVLAGGLVKASDATAAGIWAMLGPSSRPVTIDEAESDPNSLKMKKVIEFVRQAPSGGVVLRGSADQTSAAFRVQSAFLFGSIIIPPLLSQDLTRFAILELGPLDKKAPLKLDRNELAAMGAGLRARLIAQWPRWQETLEVWRSDLAASGCSPRQQDQYGTLLAMYDLATGNELMPSDLRQALVAPLSAARLDEDAHVPTNAEAMLGHFLTSTIEVFRGGNRLMVRTVLEAAIPTYPDEGREHPATPGSARDALREHGIIVTGRPEEVMIGLPNSHAGLARIFEGSQWRGEPGASGGWAQAMKRLPGAVSVRGRAYAHRGWAAPATSIVGDHKVSVMPNDKSGGASK